MKNIKKSTWIAIGCVALAILASQVYSTVQKTVKQEEEVAVVSEIRPTPIRISPPSPIATKSPATPAPKSDAIEFSEIAVPVSAPDSETPVPSPTDYLLPSSGEVQRPFSDTELIYFEPLREWRCHLGIDFLPSDNAMVLATANGIVEGIYEDHLYGTTVVIDHGNALKSFYGSLSTTSVEEGKEVNAGTEIGQMGETAAAESGVHLHFWMEKDGKAIDPFGNKQ